MNDRHKARKIRQAHNKKDLSGLIFGNLKAISETCEFSGKRRIWICQCSCGKEIKVNAKYLLCGDTKSCGCLMKGNAHNRTGYKDISGSYFYSIKASANRRSIPFQITIEEIYDLLIKQNHKCAISGVDIKFVLNYRDDNKLQTASLDRIDSSKSYTIDNVHWVHKTVNIMKNSIPLSEFINWCKKITINC